MSNGEVIKRVVKKLQNDPRTIPRTVDIPEDTTIDCCFCIPAFGNTGDDDDLLNDFHSFLWNFNSFITGATLHLQKWEGSGFVDKVALTDSSYGEFFSFGFKVINGDNLIGYRIDWRTVLADVALGVGSYRLRIELTDVLGTTSEKFSFAFNLKHYNAVLVNRSVRVEFTNNNFIGNWEDYTKKKNFSDLAWTNQVRLPCSIFGKETSTFETDEVQFADGFVRDLEDDQDPKYILDCDGLPFWLHRFMKVEAFQADTILMTDYNSRNAAGTFVELNVKRDGDYTPNYESNPAEPSVSVQFKLRQNNLKKDIC